MKVRVLLVVLLTLVVGAGAGYAVAGSRGDDDAGAAPESVTITPVPAEPGVPVDVVQPDPDDDPLVTGIALDQRTLTADSADGKTTYSLSLPVPVGWTERLIGTALWRYTVPGNDLNSYGFRAEIIADQGESIASALVRRTSEFDSAKEQGNMRDLDVTIFDTDDGFEASFIDTGGFRRVSVERFYAGPDGTAFATVAMAGRERDLEGLRDLLARITRDLRPTQKPS